VSPAGLPESLTIAELAEHLHCGVDGARAVARQVGYIVGGGGWRVRRDWLEEWERAQRRLAPEPEPAAPRRRRRARPHVDYANLPEGFWRREGGGT
jgi:hypothetical protein